MTNETAQVEVTAEVPAAGGPKPAEASLYDDPTTADLGSKVAEAWAEFRGALAGAVPRLPTGSVLDLTLDSAATGIGDALFGVSIEPVDAEQLRAYAVGNTSLPPQHRLTRSAVADLVALGWSPPGVVTGSEGRFGLELPAAEANRLAAILGRTLREIYGTPHPAFLVYTARDADGDQVEVPPLGAARVIPPDADGRLPGDLADLSLPEKVAAVIAAMLKTTPENLPLDKDGDIGIRSGSAMVFVRVRDNPPLIDVFSPVLTNVDASEALYRRLSELTNRMPIGRLYCMQGIVWASVPVFGRDFQATHLMLAVQVMTGLADELDDRLAGEFGGRRFFGEGDLPSSPQSPKGKESSTADPDDDHGTGLYL